MAASGFAILPGYLPGEVLAPAVAELESKYTGANDYDQELHCDYLNHTLVAPTRGTEQQQVEMFVYLADVPEDLGPPHLVPTDHTADLPAKPNWYARHDPSGTSDADADAPEGFLAPAYPEFYEREVSAAGPAGTVVAFQLGTFHRGTALRYPGLDLSPWRTRLDTVKASRPSCPSRRPSPAA